MTPISAIKAIWRPAKFPMRSANTLSWKNMPSVNTDNNQSGKKIVVKVTIGILYKGISKWA